MAAVCRRQLLPLARLHTRVTRASCYGLHARTPCGRSPIALHGVGGIGGVRRQHTSPGKPFYITTPIFYVNAKPHIGHLYSLVLTDVVRRHRALCGSSGETCMLTGVDEHGMKIQRAADAAGQDPQIFCDAAADAFGQLPALAGVHPEVFMRTTSAAHKDAVAHFWRVLEDKGYLFRARHSGWYSVSDETFFPETAVQDVLAHDGSVQKVSVETGNVVEWAEEDNWHFRLSAMREPLLELYRHNPDMIVPRARCEDVVAAVESGLADLSVSRPSSRLSWGIRVPGDDSQTIYVWLDALVNYITACGYPSLDARWPADVHVIGKDIVRFHCIYWPAFLLAAGVAVPKRILAHSHWTLGNLKMSKSRGNVVDPWQALDRFGQNTVRYYLIRDGRIENDGNYDARNVVIRHNHELANGLGNLVSRLTAPRLDVAGAIDRFDDALLADVPDDVRSFPAAIDGACAEYDRQMKALYPHRALASVVQLVDGCNALLQRHEPWSASCAADVRTAVLALAAEGARCASIMLQPIIPNAASTLLDQLGVSVTRRGMQHAAYRADDAYRPIAHVRPPKAKGQKEDRASRHVFTKIDDGNPPIHNRSRAVVQEQLHRLSAMAAHDKLD